MEPLQPAFRRQLRARAHALHPVVAIGHHGLTASVMHEIDVALNAHELIKVRVFNDDRSERDALLTRIAESLHCAPVQQIGKLLVLWRPRPAGDQATTDQASRRRDARDRSAPERRRRHGAGVHAATPSGKTRARKPASKAASAVGAPAGGPTTRPTPGASASKSVPRRSFATSAGTSRKNTPKPADGRAPRHFGDTSGPALRRRRRVT